MKANPTFTALYEMQKRIGFMNASRVLEFVMEWTSSMDQRGWPDDLRIEDHMSDWKCSPATSYRRLAKFREAFPGETTPTRLVLVARAELKRRRIEADAGAIATSIATSPLAAA